MHTLWLESSNIQNAMFYEKYLTVYTLQEPGKTMYNISSFNQYLYTQ
jgi:hypothetical protein